MNKKILAFALALIMALGAFSAAAMAADTLSITLDGRAVAAESPPFVDANGRTMVPVRFVSEALGAGVGWDAGSQTVTITKDQTVITLVIGSRIIDTNGAEFTMDTAAIISGGRTFVPVRYIAEALGLGVGWDGATKTVILTTGTAQPTPAPTPPSEAAAGNEWLKMSKSSYAAHEDIIVTVSGITAQMEDDVCWISIYRTGYKHDEFGEYFYPRQGTSTFTFNGNLAGGDWEIRLYRSGNSDKTYTDANLVATAKFKITY